MNIAAIIVGIDGWEKYTLPLVASLQKHEPECDIVVVDNASHAAYPHGLSVRLPHGAGWRSLSSNAIARCDKRICYSAAINYGKSTVGDADWYIVLSNDVLCTGPFAHILAELGDSDLVGPLLKEAHGFPYLEGWCVCVPARAWQAWDERFLGSDYEDVAYSTAARQRGVGLIEDKSLPFAHLDQRQRFSIVDDFAGKNAHNRELFLREYGRVTA